MRTWMAGIIGILVLDQSLKNWALLRLPEEGGRLNSLVSFRLHKNYGIAFDIPAPQSLIILVTLLIIFAAVYGLIVYKNQLRVAVPLFLITAGGLGNLFDRVVHGFTVDYIILFTRSAINLSDVMIIVGVLALLFAWPKNQKTSSLIKEEASD